VLLLLTILISFINNHAVAFSIIVKKDSYSVLPNRKLDKFPRIVDAKSTKILRQTLFDDDDLQNSNRIHPSTKSNFSARIRSLGQLIIDRCDTLRSAGFYDTVERNDGLNAYHNYPLIAGFKTNASFFLLAFGYKCYRSIFINKMNIWERQPQWNTVMTSREMEVKAELKAYKCIPCGSTLFIAKGRKWFQMPADYKCYACGASGSENFVDVREELLEDMDDDYFDYEKPLDFLSASERRQLMKQAGGDEAKATALLQNTSAKKEEVVSNGEEKKDKDEEKENTMIDKEAAGESEAHASTESVVDVDEQFGESGSIGDDQSSETIGIDTDNRSSESSGVDTDDQSSESSGIDTDEQAKHSDSSNISQEESDEIPTSIQMKDPGDLDILDMDNF